MDPNLGDLSRVQSNEYQSLCTYDFELTSSDVAVTINIKLRKCGLRSVLPFHCIGLLELVDVQGCCNKLIEVHHPIRIAIHLSIQGPNSPGVKTGYYLLSTAGCEEIEAQLKLYKIIKTCTISYRLKNLQHPGLPYCPRPILLKSLLSARTKH
jgi:hypothetical protein